MKVREVNFVSETEYLAIGLPTLNPFYSIKVMIPKA